MKLEIGAGARAHDGYIAYDVNPERADIVGDAQHLPFPDGSIDAMRAVDVLEHISYRDTDQTLKEWARVCASHAPLYVQVPDARLIFHWFIVGDERLHRIDTGTAPRIVGAAWRLLGGHADGQYVADTDDWRWNAHYSLWDAEYLTASLNQAGFTVESCVTNGHPNLCATATRR